MEDDLQTSALVKFVSGHHTLEQNLIFLKKIHMKAGEGIRQVFGINVGRQIKKKKSVLAIQAAIILAAIVVVMIQVPVITESLQAEQPVRIGTYETNSSTDQCIEILWKTAKGLQGGALPGPDSVCPASNKPLVVSEENGDLIVRVPDPELP